MPVHVYGALIPGIEARSHVLFADRRHGDVTAGIFSSRSSLFSLHILVSPFVNVLLNALIAPFD